VKERIRIEPPSVQDPGFARQKDEVRKYLKMIPDEPEPNLGRVYEIKQKIKDRSYFEPEAMRRRVEGAAAHLTMRFLHGEASGSQ